ncbi:MAG: glycosyltransferase [Candidatus Magasanikbacteria bacterium]|nr:glycosyltransferase [Candidatus Magasanikbacteria bacterium]
MPIEVLGVKIDQITHNQALQKVADFLSSSDQHTIFTPNPEILVKAHKDEYFKKVLNSSSLNLCDGFGLWLAARFVIPSEAHADEVSRSLIGESLSQPTNGQGSFAALRMTAKIERITGTDFMLDICRIAAEQNRGVYLLGSGSDEVVKKTADNLQKQFPNLKIVGSDRGPVIVETEMTNGECVTPSSVLPLNGGGDCRSVSFPLSPSLGERQREGYASLVSKINETRPDVLLVAFGMGKQEKWIYENLAKLPSVKIAMGVGGAFDYVSGAVPRAPRLMRKIGLEWVYRLLRQPRRAGRIFNATVKFLYYYVRG